MRNHASRIKLDKGKIPIPRAKQAKRYGMLEQDALTATQDDFESNDLEGPDEAHGENDGPFEQSAAPAQPTPGKQPLHPARTESTGPGRTFTPKSFAPGTKVSIHGLQSAPQHNGKEAIVIGRHEASVDRFRAEHDAAVCRPSMALA